MKKTLYLLSLAFTPLMGQTKLDMQFHMTQGDKLVEINQEVYLDEEGHYTLAAHDLSFNIQELEKNEASTKLKVEIALQDQLISEPELVAKWGEKATVTLETAGDEKNSLSLSITPYQE